MDKIKCLELTKNLLSTFFPDSEFSIESTPGRDKIVTRSGVRISFKLDTEDPFRIVIQRKRGFTSDEENLIDNFIKFVKTKHTLENEPDYINIMMAQFTQFIAMVLSNEHTIAASIIDKYILLSDTTYEGGKVSLSCLLDLSRDGNGINYCEIISNKSGPVLTNGIDTLISVGKNGLIKDYFFCERVADLENEDESDAETAITNAVPIRCLPIAQKTDNNKIAIILNKNDEILIIKNKNLIFSRRRGEWQYYENTILYKNLSYAPKIPHANLRKGVYLSVLDVSFSRSGGCIAIISETKKEEFDAMMLTEHANSQTYLSENIVKKYIKKKFFLISRQLRAEICAIDGAVILDQKGIILYAGKIIPVKVTSESGARTAAAKTLSKYGIGIKISMDGVAEAYVDGEIVQTFC